MLWFIAVLGKKVKHSLFAQAVFKKTCNELDFHTDIDFKTKVISKKFISNKYEIIILLFNIFVFDDKL